MNPHLQAAMAADDSLFARRYVLFAAPKQGAEWPYLYRLHHDGEVRSVALTWPDWLPYLDVKRLVPTFAGAHPRWPIRVGDDAGGPRTAPGAKVAAIFTDNPITRDAMRRRYWVDVTEDWHAARLAHLEALANPAPVPVPAPGLVAKAGEVVAAVARIKRGPKAPEPAVP